jgi:hypothetical protein
MKRYTCVGDKGIGQVFGGLHYSLFKRKAAIIVGSHPSTQPTKLILELLQRSRHTRLPKSGIMDRCFHQIRLTSLNMHRDD